MTPDTNTQAGREALELAACPFCGGEPTVWMPEFPLSADCGDANVACQQCDAVGPNVLIDMDIHTLAEWPELEREAIAAWNARHLSPTKAEPVAWPNDQPPPSPPARETTMPKPESGGRWDFCPACGSVGWVDWGYSIHMDLGSCPFPQGVGEETLERAADECDRLNDLEAVADPEPITVEDLAVIPSDPSDDPYSAFAYRGGNP